MSRAAVTTTNEPQCGASGVLGERNEPDWSYCCVALRVPSLSPGLQRILQYTGNRNYCVGQQYRNTRIAKISRAVANNNQQSEPPVAETSLSHPIEHPACGTWPADTV